MTSITNPELHNPAKNFAYYASTMAYERNESRLSEERVRWVIGQILARKPRNVLDLGCNDAFIAQAIIDAIPSGLDYHGVELNPTAIENAYPAARGRIECANIVDYPLEPGKWDCVLVLETLEHLPDPGALLRRIAPALSPRGFLVTCSAAGMGEAHEPGNHEHLREWTLTEWVDLHRRAGLWVTTFGLAHVHTSRYTNVAVSIKRSGASA